MCRPGIEIEDLILSKNGKCGTLVEQTHSKPQKTLEFKFTQPMGTFQYKPSINLGLGSNWMIVITSLEVYNSNSQKIRKKNKFGLHTDLFDGISFTELKKEVEDKIPYF